MQRPDNALPIGLRDLLPDETEARRRRARAALEAYGRYGYRAVTLPAFEREEVIVRGLGPGGAEQAVRFLDPDTGDVLVLRPDMTPQVARLVATRMTDVPPPVRIAYEGSVVRRPQGRSRRHRQVAQVGVECLGWASLEADLEVLLATADALSALGLRATVELAHARAAGEALGRVDEPLRADVAAALDARDGAAWASLLRDFPAQADELAALASLAGPLDEVCAEASRALRGEPRRAAQELQDFGAKVRERGYDGPLLVDLGEARGRGYYTGVMFQFLVEGAGEPVAAGGRYDDLVGRYGASLCATGAALRLDVVERVAKDAPSRSTAVLVAGDGAWRRAVAAELRAAGRTAVELDESSPARCEAYARAHGLREVRAPWGSFDLPA